MILNKLWMFLHLIGLALWMGGMFFMLYCLRPSLHEQMEGLPRARLMLSVQGRFFRFVFLAIALLWISGIAMMGNAIANGLSPLPLGWHVMAALAGFMTLVFLFIRFVLFPRAHKALLAQDGPALARLMEDTRASVLVNLGMGVGAMAAALFGR